MLRASVHANKKVDKTNERHRILCAAAAFPDSCSLQDNRGPVSHMYVLAALCQICCTPLTSEPQMRRKTYVTGFSSETRRVVIAFAR